MVDLAGAGDADEDFGLSAGDAEGDALENLVFIEAQEHVFEIDAAGGVRNRRA